MADLRLRYAGVSYYDKTRALERGEVSPAGVFCSWVLSMGSCSFVK